MDEGIIRFPVLTAPITADNKKSKKLFIKF
jgi:hypothetical protein